MPNCAKCQSPYEEGQKFCRQCGNHLPIPEKKASFCPQCGVQVSDQVFCHKCGAALREEGPGGQIPVYQPPSPAAPSPGKPPAHSTGKGMSMQTLGLIGGGIGIAVVLVVLIIAGISRDSSTIPVKPPAAPIGPGTSATPAPPSAATPTKEPETLGPPFFTKPTKVVTAHLEGSGPAGTADSGLTVQEELEELLFKMKQAQESKDIDRLMACFSPTFPNLEKKRQDSQKIWGAYDYANYVFTINDIKPMAPGIQQARITLGFQLSHRKTRKVETQNYNFLFEFSKEGGLWRIKSLNELEGG